MKLEASWEIYVGRSVAVLLDPWIGMILWGMVLHEEVFSSTGWTLPYLSYWQMFWISLLGKILFTVSSPTRFKSKE